MKNARKPTSLYLASRAVQGSQANNQDGWHRNPTAAIEELHPNQYGGVLGSWFLGICLVTEPFLSGSLFVALFLESALCSKP